MLATGELQPLATQLDFLELAELLGRKVAGEPLPSFIHEVNAYSAAPEDLVRGRGPAPGTDGREMAWYFCGAANCHESAGGAPRRNRQVGGGRERSFWHPEGGKKPILGRDGKPVGAYWRTLSYVLKTKNPSGAKKSFRNTRLGWCMNEIGLDHHHRLVLCKVYRSPRSTESCTATAGAEDVGPAPAGTGLSGVEDGLHDSARQGGAIPDVAGGGMPCPPEPAPVSYDYNLHSLGLARKPALLIGPASKHGTLAIVNKSNAASVEATILMKFDGSSIPSGERMKEMAKLVLVSQNPVLVLSAMGNTNTNIRLAAWKALRCGARKASEINELAIIKELHLRTIDELGLDRSTVSGPLDELEQHLQYVAMTKELTPSTKDYLISFGERASTKMFSDYLNKLGKQEWELCSVTNFGRSGGDLTTTTTGRALGLREIQVWRDVDSMFTCDPNVCGNAIHVPYLTFDEGVELKYIGEQSMQIAVEGGIKVIVKNS
ncbi:hypothetical protein ACQJBY_047164 [Aegilops geniculata]